MPGGQVQRAFSRMVRRSADCSSTAHIRRKLVDGTGRLTGQADYREKPDARVWCHVGMVEAYRPLRSTHPGSQMCSDVPSQTAATRKSSERQIDLLAQDASPFVKGQVPQPGHLLLAGLLQRRDVKME